MDNKGMDSGAPVSVGETVGNEAHALLARLEARRLQERAPTRRPARLALGAIKRHEALFQPRAEVPGHVSELVHVLKGGEMLDPLTVIQVGKEAVLIDGHHRHTAYRRAKIGEPVPVSYFEGTISDAVIEAGQANRKAKLPMTTQQRQDRAWQLVLLGCFSKVQERHGSGAANGTIGTMRRVKKALGDNAAQHRTWWAALAASRGQEWGRLSDAELEERLEAQAADYAERLHKAFGSQLTGNVELAAKALERHFGDHLGGLVHALQGYVVPMLADDDDGDF